MNDHGDTYALALDALQAAAYADGRRDQKHDDASLLSVLKLTAHLLAESSDQSPRIVALRGQIVNAIRTADPHYGD